MATLEPASRSDFRADHPRRFERDRSRACSNRAHEPLRAAPRLSWCWRARWLVAALGQL